MAHYSARQRTVEAVRVVGFGGGPPPKDGLNAGHFSEMTGWLSRAIASGRVFANAELSCVAVNNCGNARPGDYIVRAGARLLVAGPDLFSAVWKKKEKPG